jgi:phosphopantothenoylcysteine decarboxylase/phosphopantothenate--cysteine ligase
MRMASLTVRQLDDKLKKLLRLRAVRNGRSMEDEIRVILRAAAAPAPETGAGSRSGGGQQTYPSHHRRRHRRL